MAEKGKPSRSRLENRRMRYLAGSSLLLALIARVYFPSLGVRLDMLAALGLFCFLAWFVSDILAPRIELQEAAHKLVRRYKQWERDGIGRGPFFRAVDEYMDAIDRAVAARPHLEILGTFRDSERLDLPGPRITEGIGRLRRWARWRLLYRLL